MALRLNVYNALNINTVVNALPASLTRLSGSSFGKPRTIAPSRIAELSASYTF